MQTLSPPTDGWTHRRVDTVVTVLGVDGRPLADAEVTAGQTRHSFAFGNIGFDLIDHAAGHGAPGDTELAADWLGLFNTATLPFYWGQFEQVRGAPDTQRLLSAARWFVDRGVTVKGHPLVWHTEQPPWLLGLGLDDIERLQRERIRREVGGFAGLIDTWDAINEVVIMPVFENGDNGITRLAFDRGRIAMVRLAIQEARAANPHVRLLINDFDLSSAYECLLEGLLDAGVEIDAIGLQTHMHQGYRGEDAMLAMVDRFARYGLPLHLTETSLVSGRIMPADVVDLNDYQVPVWPSTPQGEARQADELARHYRSLVRHPTVEAITYWGITDRGAWLGAPIGLLRTDGSRKPSYDALHDLIKGEWWCPPTTVTTDADGRFRLNGFRGDYVVECAGATGTLSTEADDDSLAVRLTA